MDREEHLLVMPKQLTAIISDWNTETQQMMEKLQHARDEQVCYDVFCKIVFCATGG